MSRSSSSSSNAGSETIWSARRGLDLAPVRGLDELVDVDLADRLGGGLAAERRAAAADRRADGGGHEVRAPRLDRLGVRLAAVEAGRDDGDAHLVAERVVDDGTEDDVRLGVHGLLHEAGRVVDLEDAEVRAALDREQHAVRAVDRRLEQRTRDRELGRLDRAVGAPRRADAHERRARHPA